MGSAGKITHGNGFLLPLQPMKHDILGFSWSAMVRETQVFNLPLLNENPFSIRPLEEGEAGKLVGRSEVFTRLKEYLRLGTARRVMLTGPVGSGRTSLVRCLKPYAGHYASIDHLPANAPATNLLEMCYRQIIGGEPPRSRTELVNQLVNEMYAFSGKLPLIVIDVPATDVSVLEVALRDTHASLERLNALVVLVCDAKERHQLPATITNRFERFQMKPFTPADVHALVHQRLAMVGVMNSGFSIHDATAVLDSCDGYPYTVITVLRNAVDNIRMGAMNSLPATYVDTSARLQPRDDPSITRQLMPEPVEHHVPSSPELSEPEEQSTFKMLEGSDVIDASLPWDQRPDSGHEGFEQNDGSGQEPVADELPDSVFELDINALSLAQGKDDPLQEAPFDTPIMDASATADRSQTTVGGMFRSIAQRGRGLSQLVKQDKEEGVPNQHELVDHSSEAFLWVHESSLQKPAEPEVSEDESAALIHDEIGLPEPLVDLPEPSYDLDSLLDLQGLDDAEHVTEPVLEASNPAAVEADLFSNSMALDLLQQALLSLQSQSTTPLNHGLLEFFQRRQMKQLGPREAFPLNKHILGGLNQVDAYVVSMANQRLYSPSDEEMLEHLSIKRSRLSQISNRLLKHGILQVQTFGRSRKYSLTQAARAQLIAWGGLRGVDAQ